MPRGALGIVVLVVLSAVLAVPSVRAAADEAPPPGERAGSGHVEGTETVNEATWSSTQGALCQEETKSIYGLRGVGTYQGRTVSGQDVVYTAAVDESQGQTGWADGPLRIEVENTQTYYLGPFGTYGSDANCSPSNIGTAAPAEFRVFAADHVYRLGGGGAQGPCVGHGSFARGNAADSANSTQKFHAEWTLDAACTVVGNQSGAPATGTAPAGSPHTLAGTHEPCFADSCATNLRVDYVQFLPFKGLHVAMGGADSAQTGSTASVTARVTNDGQPLANAAVTFSVAGPAPAAPPGGAAVTNADGRVSFTFTAASAGSYSVTASVTNGTTTASGARVVQFAPPPPPALVLDGRSRAQTENAVTVTATLTNAGTPLPAAQVAFSVTGPAAWQSLPAGQPTPSSGSAVTDQNGQATFTFSAGRAGDHTVTASSSTPTGAASGSHVVHLDIKSFEVTGRQATKVRWFHPSGAAVMDPAGRHAFFGGIEEFELNGFQPGRFSDLNVGSDTAVISPAGDYAYLGKWYGGVYDAEVAKVDLRTLQQVGVIPIDAIDRLASAVIDPAGRYAYFGTLPERTSSFGRVVKVDLATMQQVGSITLPADEMNPTTAVMDPAGRYAYFGTSYGPVGHVVKIDLTTFQRVGSAALDGGAESALTAAVIDPAGSFAYFGAGTNGGSAAGRVVKVDLGNLRRVGAIPLEARTNALSSAVMDPAGHFAYFGAHHRIATATGTDNGPSALLKVDLDTFQMDDTLYLAADETADLDAAVIDPAGSFAYFGKTATPLLTGVDQEPAKIVKVAVSRAPVAWLAAGDDTFSTPYASPLSVAAPGVLANDHDSGDGDPLTAVPVRAPAHGTVSLRPNGSFSYTPASGFSGTDAFTYKASDAMDYSAPATVTVTVAAPPDGVQAVSGSAVGFETNLGLFGGPPSIRGGSGSSCGQAGQATCGAGQSPAVSLPPSGGGLSAADPDGGVGQYGPAQIFESHGPMTVRAQGSTGPSGSVTASASVSDISDNDPFHAGAPDGVVSSTCTASPSDLAGSARVVNGRVVTSTDPTTGDPTSQVTFPHTWDPAPNTEYEGTLDHVGDRWRIVFNEQILGPDSITVNAVHMYLLGSTAVGDMIIGQSSCGVSLAAPDAPPTATNDTFTTRAGRELSVPGPGVLGNDTVADGKPLTAAKPQGTRPPASGGGSWTFPGDPPHGKVTLTPDGGFTYTPEAGFAGVDSFAYLAQDPRGRTATGTVSITVDPATIGAAVADFDGNHSSDVAVYRPGSGAWFVQGGLSTGWGAAGDVPVPADYDGNGTTDVAVFRPSDQTWYVQGGVATQWGIAGDVPVPGDYDGDGSADIAVYRPSDQTWYVQGGKATQWGTDGDVPVPGDYDGNGTTDVAVFRPSSQTWYVQGGVATQWGTNGDVPVSADFNGDGKTDVAVYRPSDQTWYSQGAGGIATQWGASGDIAVPGDYNGDGRSDVAVFRRSDATWYVQGGLATQWGTPGDIPLTVPAHLRTLYGL